MGRRISKNATKNRMIAQQALANLLVGTADEQVAQDVRHRRANPEPRYAKSVKAKTPNQEIYMRAIEESNITFGIGPAGTGKTYLAVKAAFKMLATNQVSKIILTRPAVEAEDERIGFLPGDMNEKLHPYLLPLLDIAEETVGRATLATMRTNGQIEIAPLAFMRGRTFSNSVIIIDEGQNASRGQFKMALTRLGEGSKAILTGDPDQSDLEFGKSGLLATAEALCGRVPGVAVVRFGKSDIVRSKIVSDILEYL